MLRRADADARIACRATASRHDLDLDGRGIAGSDHGRICGRGDRDVRKIDRDRRLIGVVGRNGVLLGRADGAGEQQAPDCGRSEACRDRPRSTRRERAQAAPDLPAGDRAGGGGLAEACTEQVCGSARGAGEGHVGGSRGAAVDDTQRPVGGDTDRRQTSRSCDVDRDVDQRRDRQLGRTGVVSLNQVGLIGADRRAVRQRAAGRSCRRSRTQLDRLLGAGRERAQRAA